MRTLRSDGSVEAGSCEFRKWLPFLPLFLLFAIPNTIVAQASNEQPDGLMIVIFSSETENPRRDAAQKTAWSSFVTKLKKSKTGQLEAINEIAMNDAADKVRALEIAANEKTRFTVWLNFSGIKDLLANNRGETVNLERLVAEYYVFTPASNNIIGEGIVEQDRIRESEFETYIDHQALRKSGGRVVNTTPPSHKSDPASAKNPLRMDVNGLKKVGESVAEKVSAAVKNYTKKPL